MVNRVPPSTPSRVRWNVLRDHTIAIWCKHGLMTRSEISMMQAYDRIEYAETAAKYEYFNLTLAEAAQGLSVQEILGICEHHKVDQKVF